VTGRSPRRHPGADMISWRFGKSNIGGSRHDNNSR
jgi:hypothetical protein